MHDGDSRPFRTVPDVVGLPFSLGRRAAVAHGVKLANPDPDGPPAGALAWPEDLVIVAQEPTVGAVIRQWDSVKVWLQGGPDALAAARRDPLRADPAHAVPGSDPLGLDLSGSGEAPGRSSASPSR